MRIDLKEYEGNRISFSAYYQLHWLHPFPQFYQIQFYEIKKIKYIHSPNHDHMQVFQNNLPLFFC